MNNKTRGAIVVILIATVEICLFSYVAKTILESFAVVGIYLLALGQMALYQKYGLNKNHSGHIKKGLNPERIGKEENHSGQG